MADPEEREQSRLLRWQAEFESGLAKFMPKLKPSWTHGRLITAMVVLGLALLALAVYQYWLCCRPSCQAWWCKPVNKSLPWTLLTALVTAPALILTWYWREDHKREDLRIATEGQVTERFTKAIEHLGHTSMAIRLGAIYALERIMKDSPQRDHWTIVETLSAFVRMSAPWREPLEGEQGSVGGQAPVVPAEDVQAALTVLGRRNSKWDLHYGRIDLKKTDMWRADLSRADLQWANLEGANLREAHLEGANLGWAYHHEAHLEGAHLQWAILYGLYLREAHLEGANLVEAHLEGASLEKAHLEGADLRGANLSHADLSTAVGLTRDQLSVAILDVDTKLPPEFVDLIPPEKPPAS